ncbi:37119_t:CDS:2, partial [Gigaspora margarita]
MKQVFIIPIAQVFRDPVLLLPLANRYIPTVSIPLVTETAPVNFIIDLYRVQQLVLNEQNNT